MKALILVDLQVDFCPMGALEVKDGDQVIAVANRLMEAFDFVVATKDWHPGNHGSFAANHPWRYPGQVIDLHGLPQVLWPMHCVQNSFGAEFYPTLESDRINEVIYKGTDPEIDSYSGFFDNGHRKATGLKDLLLDHKIDEVFIMGLATDYCVKFTALDAVEIGFKTWLIQDGCKGVELNPGDTEKALKEMEAAGVLLTSEEKVRELSQRH